MVFSSIIFIFFFLPIFLIVYYLLPKKIKVYWLLIASLLFYAWGEPTYIVLIIFSSFIDYLNGRLLKKCDNEKRRKIYLFFAIAINLSLLGFFKYSNFLITVINQIFSLSINHLDISLPIGISFYTFQTISYSIDVYRKSVEVEDNYFRYLTYVSLFPQLVAGPIVRYSSISNEIRDINIDIEKFSNGFLRFLKGLFKKVLIANNIGMMYELILASNLKNASILTLWFGIIGYAIQIYFDFSGYSDMAIGLGKMLGFTFLENFDYPYISKSIGEFWRRWHISLNTWFKDYILYPFLKSDRIQKLQSILKEKVSKKFAKHFITALGTMLIFTLTGIWHGANYNYIMWGLYYGIILIIEEIFLKDILKKNSFLSHIYVILIVLFGYVIFSIEDMSLLKEYFGGLFGIFNNPIIDNNFIFYLKNYSLILIIGIVFSTPILKIIPEKIKNSNIYLITKCAIYIILFIVSISYIVSSSYNPFLYFRF